ncbi:hypothetical protein NLO85_21775 [Pseudomonas savastanoi]|uniref:Uncharacterized protein n=1 Tax=Pseudomonas savastanoi TaxID=29438 RepID=A0AAW5J9V4_PSESS|nr:MULTISPECIES: hypothetical protein [Pseudomonas]KAA3536654.1 hypothetical protein DXU85_23265 [Pseudomonas savastanoi]MCQ3023127.1 hypothetical protein [Pseudomonas savastanoi]RML75942.1 hypothetical protein ALQ90_03117 [Pseudomonas savastanoi pv. savastanoi]TSC36762.1 hypothetical protein FOM00_12010 [Pseudomonas sp. ST1]UKL12325.1 hypothetical protein HQ966_13645 [Pseudomonas savastanoi pv. savastanoi]
MSDVLIKPLRAYEDRGTIRDTDNEPYAAPVWLAKELEQLKLCKIVGEAGAALTNNSSDRPPLTIAKKGQRWIIVDAEGSQVGEFIGKKEEAESELAKLSTSTTPDPAGNPEPDVPGEGPPVQDENSPPQTEQNQPPQE